ncbi:MAG: hydrogenase maturation peptidase HycI [Hadesarchaea archaeon]|nr:MAG: hydrogenase maturation peptidase HycI [Hadesarchaea archaeon]TEU15120.1 MAG: hydrogenase maturation peptidase HycI [Hadesarchaea archaeon]
MPLELSSFLKGADRVAIVGVGSEMRGDDAAGIEVVRGLRHKLKSSRVLLVEGGVAPESFTSTIRRFKPSHVIFIDATDFGAEPGEVILAEPEAITGQSISTHTLPLSILAGYLREQTGAKIILLGIQPARAQMGAEMGEPIKDAVEKVDEALLRELGSL